MKNKMYLLKTLLIVFVFILSVVVNAQTSYSLLFETQDDKYAKHVFNDPVNNKQIVIIYEECFYTDDTTCLNKRSVYSITEDADTIQWAFEDRRNDTVFDINSIHISDNGEYYLIGTGWTEIDYWIRDYPFDFIFKYNTYSEKEWESFQELPEQFVITDFRGASDFHIVELLNGNILIGKTITVIDTYLDFWNYLSEINHSDGGLLIKKKVLPKGVHGHMQGLTYSIDSSNIIVHTSSSYLLECNKSVVGAVMLDTITYDTISSYCYPRDDDPPEKTHCPHVPYNAALHNDGSLIVAGTGICTNLYTSGHEEYLFIYKYDTAFNIIDSTYLTNKDTLFDASWYKSLDININGEICMAGNHNRHIGPWASKYSWVYLVKLDENLNVISERYLGGDAYYVAYSMVATDDGGIVVSGSRFDYLQNNQERDAFIIKTDGGLWVTNNENNTIPVHSALVYPNPGNESFTLRTTEYPSTLLIMDMSGKSIIHQTINDRETLIFTNSLKPGFYYWQLIKGGEKIDTGKWIKTKK